MSKSLPYCPWFGKDFAGDPKVIAMTDMQELAYRRLLDMSWEMGPLPNDVAILARLARMPRTKFRRVWAYPLTDCWRETEDGQLVNDRLEIEKSRVLDRSEKAKSAASVKWSRRPKRLKTKDRDHANASPEHCSSDADAMHPDPDPDPKDLSKERTERSVDHGATRANLALARSLVQDVEEDLCVWWNGNEKRLEASPGFWKHVDEVYFDAPLGLVRETFRSLDRYLQGHPAQLLSITRGQGLRPWVISKFREDIALAKAHGIDFEGYRPRGGPLKANALDALRAQEAKWAEEREAFRAKESAAIAACAQEHDTEGSRRLSESGRVWLCVDGCGWSERVRAEREKEIAEAKL